MSKGTVVMRPCFYIGYAAADNNYQYVPVFNLDQAHALAQAQAAQYNNSRALNEAIYSTDEFRMYTFKIKRCTKTRPHDWTECPYAHRNEKAQRRDPRKYPYSGIACPAFHKTRSCPKGDNCEYAHGVFEYWLHPERYRTRRCNEGKSCTRRVCFFAHRHDDLRFPDNKMIKYCCHKHSRMMMMMPTTTMMMMMDGGDIKSQVMTMEFPAVDIEGSSSSSTSMKAHCVELPSPEPPQLGGLTHLLKSLEKLKMNEDELKAREKKMKMKMKDTAESDVEDLDLPRLEWYPSW